MLGIAANMNSLSMGAVVPCECCCGDVLHKLGTVANISTLSMLLFGPSSAKCRVCMHADDDVSEHSMQSSCGRSGCAFG